MLYVFKILTVFIVLLNVFSCQSPSYKLAPMAKKGVLDLRHWNMNQQKGVSLTGEWEFYFQQYLSSAHIKNNTEKYYIDIPTKGGSWRGWPWKGKTLSSFGYATYHLQIFLPQQKIPSLSLKVPVQNTAYRLYINDKLLATVGKAGKNSTSSVPEYLPKIVKIPTGIQVLNLAIQVANFSHRKGGLSRQLSLNTSNTIQAQDKRSAWVAVFLMGTFFMMGVYHLFLFFLYRKDTSSLFFAFICFLTLSRNLVLGEIMIKTLWPSIAWSWILKIEYISFFGNILCATLFAKALFPKEFSGWFIKVILLFNMLGIALVLVTPVYIHSFIFPYVYIIIPFLMVIFGYAIVAMVRKKTKGSTIFVIGNVTVILTILNDVLHHSGMIYSPDLIFLGVFIYFFSQAFLIAQRFSMAFFQVETTSKELQALNENLELIVQDRTSEIQAQSDFIEEKNVRLEIQAQRISDSIKVAQNVQQMILPDELQLKKYLTAYFMLYRPKDVVSGDFYWITQLGNQTIVAVGDCAGHGVPGAMMTMIGKMLLDSIVKQQKIKNPAAILNCLHQEVLVMLEKENNDSYFSMDMVIVSLEKSLDDQWEVTFSGARNNLYYIIQPYRELKFLKGTRKSVGDEHMPHTLYSNQQIMLTKGDLIYMGSDGLADQNNHHRKRFGTKLLYALLRENARLSLPQQKEVLEEALDLHMRKSVQRDDILWMGIRV